MASVVLEPLVAPDWVHQQKLLSYMFLSIFLQPTDLFLRKEESISCPYMLSLVTFVWIMDFGPMSLHWLQGMPFWASWLSGYLQQQELKHTALCTADTLHCGTTSTRSLFLVVYKRQ
jgi:hypothetical protein